MHVSALLAGRRRVADHSDSASAGGQAALIQAWTETGKARFLMANDSQRPVHDVCAFVVLGRRRRPTYAGWVRTLEPTGDHPAKVALTADAREMWLRRAHRDQSAAPDVPVEFTFRDADDQYWHRTRRGDLVATDGVEAARHVRRSRVS